ncbi:hypothetical protein GYMLUDRAFT_245604 [Collybiopsis luxurians FD-317 M1]|uniref:FAD/NAD(P)-binding domain-containing protein n=1 Tax=Collybiopsis luxurians FD-317 M1 TaxID=944289 RepID=A0A0D0B6V7_9AGAR|nr:hypothetical protein GYMLUDRAFT_245604 [Collybiopsis luxurians FD-317 M1]
MSQVQEFDAVVVGGGFSGVHQLMELRKLGLKVRLLEAGSGLGGAWFWNRYPGARVDSVGLQLSRLPPNPVYQFKDPELWKDWTFSEKYSSWEEIQAYFKYVDQKRDLSRDVSYNSRVVSAVWDESANRWTIKTQSGDTYRSQYLCLCIGISAKEYVPDFKGLDTFKGEVHHTSNWPEKYDLKGKKIAVIGTGASGVQVIQEAAAVAEQLTVFQRTPNMALPMRQAKTDPKEEERKKKTVRPYEFRRLTQTFTGYCYDLSFKPTLEATPEERRLVYEDLWEKGGLLLWSSSFGDLFLNDEANDQVYNFWREKVRERINDPEVAEILAPTTKPHPFGLKRPSLEQNYYDLFNQPNVKIINIKKNPITEVTPDGIKTSDGTEHKIDILVLATGYDMVSGSTTAIDIRGQDGVSIKEKWNEGVKTYLGIGAAGFPNMFWVFGPQAPLAFANAQTSIEPTSEWVANCIKYCRENGIESLTPAPEAQDTWAAQVLAIAEMGLYYKAESWYIGANIPGKKRELLQFAGGIPNYLKAINDSASNNYFGWVPKKVAA